jgi:hypothetical protein
VQGNLWAVNSQQAVFYLPVNSSTWQRFGVGIATSIFARDSLKKEVYIFGTTSVTGGRKLLKWTGALVDNATAWAAVSPTTQGGLQGDVDLNDRVLMVTNKAMPFNVLVQ